MGFQSLFSPDGAAASRVQVALEGVIQVWGWRPFSLPTQLRDVFMVYLGSRPVVTLCGYKAVRGALVDQAEAFCG